MSLRNAFLPSVAALFTMNPLNVGGQAQSAGLQGAWRIVRTSLTTANQPRLVDYGQPSLLLFTARHYSLMYVEGNQPRQLFGDPARPTEAEKLDAFDTLVGHSGTYSVADSIIAMQIDISKSPNMMGTELRNTFAVRLPDYGRHVAPHASQSAGYIHHAVDPLQVRPANVVQEGPWHHFGAAQRAD